MSTSNDQSTENCNPFPVDMDFLEESSLSDNGDAFIFLARFVGVLVIISATLTALMILISLRASLVYGLKYVGVTGILLSLFFSVKFGANFKEGKEGNQIIKKIMNIYYFACC